jgi:hypothetical protein
VTVPQHVEEQDIALSGVSVGAPAAVQERSLEGRREDARTAISLMIVGTFAFIIAGAFVLFFRVPNPSADEIVKFCQALIGPVAGIVGAVTGFYFGASQAQRSSGGSSP